MISGVCVLWRAISEQATKNVLFYYINKATLSSTCKNSMFQFSYFTTKTNENLKKFLLPVIVYINPTENARNSK